MKSIRARLAVNMIFIIIITIIILELLIINIVRQNYYKNLEDNLQNQVLLSADLYARYFADSTLYDNVLNNVDTFWKQTAAQVQIWDSSGQILMDSIGAVSKSESVPSDVKAALEGRKGSWTGKVEYDDELVMAVACPLKSGDTIVGALRFITSMREVHRDIKSISSVFILIGLAVMGISGLISILLSDTIIGPLKEVTGAAEKMAMGNFNLRSRKSYDDEIGRLSDTLNYMADEIVKRDRLKNEFISSVSHELRTPLTSIKGWAVTLKEGEFEDKALTSDGLEIIEKECDRLTSMVEELLDFSRFISGKADLKMNTIFVDDIMQHIGKQLSPRAEREGVQFEVGYETGIPPVLTDENRLKQVFINILDNSFRFTPSGGKVKFTAAIKDNRLVFEVRDSGCGIPPEDLPRIKEKFYKGKNSKSGNGIGLSICDEIIRLMDGTFDIYSEVDKGTEVIITLPLAEG